MADHIEKEKKKVELENLGWLIDRYAQSRSLPLLISLAMMIFNVVLLVFGLPLSRNIHILCR